MLIRSLATAVVILSSTTSFAEESIALRWSVDSRTVLVGGCLQIVIESPPKIAHRLAMAIGDREPIRLGRLGREVTWGGHTAILLAHDLMGVLVDDAGPESKGSARIPPFFAEPGTVELTMCLDGNPIGTKSIKVLEASDEAQGAVDLLYPTVDRDAPVDATGRSFVWIRLVINSSFGVTPPITAEQLQQLREELPIIMQHPDWAEIAEMLVARVEARAHYGQLITSAEYSNNVIKNSIDELPPLPEIVSRCLKAKPQSPFAQVIQHEIRGLERGVRILDLQRRGEDIWPILNEAARTDR